MAPGAALDRRDSIQGRERLGPLLVGFARQATRIGLTVLPAEVNGQPGAAVVDGEGRIVYVVGLDIADGAVQAVRSILNPDKLRHLRRKPWSAASTGSSPTSRQSPPARS